MKKNNVFFIIFVLTSVLLSGCKTLPDAKAPAGFAAYNGNDPFRAVTSDGVMYRVRTAGNKPYAELPFWKTAMKKHMTESGYRLVAEKDVNSDKMKGYQIELAAPSGDRDYTYLITVFVNGETLVIVEASGEMNLLKKHRKAVDEAIEKLKG